MDPISESPFAQAWRAVWERTSSTNWTSWTEIVTAVSAEVPGLKPVTISNALHSAKSRGLLERRGKYRKSDDQREVRRTSTTQEHLMGQPTDTERGVTATLTVTKVEEDSPDIIQWQASTELVTARLHLSRPGAPDFVTFYATAGTHRIGDQVNVSVEAAP